jgi:DsbC/DsbD-like thiol-disulfide interchange protein
VRRSKKFLKYLFFSILHFQFSILAVSSFAQNYKGQPVSHVSLIVGNMVSGKGFTLGIRVQLEKGWHAYWKNPGDAGLPVSAEIIDGNGYTAGELKFPTPHKYTTSGDILFGYDSEVVFLLPIKASESKSSADFKVKLNWLACKEICLPGEATLEFNSDSVSLAQRKENQRILDRWTARLPQPGSGFNMEKIGVVANQKDDKVAVFIKFLEMAPGTITDFFPEVIEGFVTDYSHIKITDEGVSLLLTPESKSSKLFEIKGIALIGTSGYEVRFPVSQ